jgi:hypothetical protein
VLPKALAQRSVLQRRPEPAYVALDRPGSFLYKDIQSDCRTKQNNLTV